MSIGRLFGGTDFADAVIERLGLQPEKLTPVHYGEADRDAATPAPVTVTRRAPAVKAMVGVDVFVHAVGISADFLAGQLSALVTPPILRWVKVWPGGFPETFCTDHWRCRFVAPQGGTVTHADIIGLLQALTARRRRHQN